MVSLIKQSFLPFLALCLLVFVQNTHSFPHDDKTEEKSENLVKAKDENEPLEWWQQTVVYQIYPRSFQDSDGDGVGDLKGIQSRLDHFVELGVGAVWLSPIYKSPMKDFGYDISDFTDIEPQFGTIKDFEELSQAMKDRGLKLILDMIPNHSSDEHEWFIKSVDKIEPYTDFYVWKNASGTDADGKPKPPNNWVSVFGDSAWQWNEKRQQFYLHQFVVGQPDLNFENIKVRNAMLAVIKFWLDKGVDGFRIDAAPFLYEDLRFLDEPIDPNRPPGSLPDEHRYYQHIYTQNLPKVTDFLARARQLLDVYTAADGHVRCMMIEAYIPKNLTAEYYGTADKPVGHFPFNFNLLDVRANETASQVLEHINVWSELMPPRNWANFLLGNHDQRRADVRWTKKGLDGANMINLLLKGTAITYYGEEFGMEDTFVSWADTVDPAGCNTDPERYEQFSRDPARTPMQWDNSSNAGFTSGNKTWLPINENYKTLNVAAQKAESESHLKVYEELVKLRNSTAWKYGDYEGKALNNDKVLGFTRFASPDGFLVLVNLAEGHETVDATVFPNVLSEGVVLIRSVGFENQAATIGSTIDSRTIQLGPRDSIVIKYMNK